MTNKENALRIIRFDRPRRVMRSVPTHVLSYTGCNHESLDGSGGHESPVGAVWTDAWGTVWKKELEGVMGFPQRHPLDPDRLDAYRWLDPDDDRVCGRIHRQAAEFDGSDRFLTGSHRETLWEKSYMLAGMETMMTLIQAEPEKARAIFRRIMDFDLGIARHYLRVGIEVASLGDDLGTQSGPLLGPRIVAEFLVPEYRRLFDLYRSRGVIITFHCCGQLDSVLDVLMDLGVNVLNPVQATANDLDAVRRRTAGRTALEGGVSTRTIIEGPPERIAAEVRQRIRQLGRDGGYFCAPDQGMPFPPAHLKAFEEAVAEYGRYPIE